MLRSRGIAATAIAGSAAVALAANGSYGWGISGFAGGFALGVLAVLVWFVLDDRLRSLDSIASGTMLAMMAALGAGGITYVRLRDTGEVSFFMAVVGLAALAGGLHRLPRQLPLKVAMGIILTGRRVGAQEALQIGIANEVVPHDELMKAARRWADQILECAPLSVRASKQSALKGLEYASIQEAMSTPYDQVAAMLKSEDLTEGPRAFAEKRPPQWKGH